MTASRRNQTVTTAANAIDTQCFWCHFRLATNQLTPIRAPGPDAPHPARQQQLFLGRKGVGE